MFDAFLNLISHEVVDTKVQSDQREKYKRRFIFYTFLVFFFQNRTLWVHLISAITFCSSSERPPSNTSTVVKAFILEWQEFAKRTLEERIFSHRTGPLISKLDSTVLFLASFRFISMKYVSSLVFGKY